MQSLGWCSSFAGGGLKVVGSGTAGSNTSGDRPNELCTCGAQAHAGVDRLMLNRIALCAERETRDSKLKFWQFRGYLFESADE